MKLRDYQQRTIDVLFNWMKQHRRKHPCLVLPTGSGKSIIVAEICRKGIELWPGVKILMMTHQKELIEQNAEKIKTIWPSAPLGIYSASVGRKEIKQVTFAGIQSIRKHVDKLGFVNAVIIDECHLISHKQQGGYRTVLNKLLEVNPNLRIIGLTATPYRLGHGIITEGDAIFDEIIEPVQIPELIEKGFLAPLRSKATTSTIDTTGVKKRGGEFVEKELQAAVDKPELVNDACAEIVSRAGDRTSWIVFCTGVDHAKNVRDGLRKLGVNAETVTGKTPKWERETLLQGFKNREIQCLTNANVLTTGFDAPNTDLIAFLRPTESTSLYVQMAGRGMRPKDHTDHCLVLDFAGLVRNHGPLLELNTASRKERGTGETSPTKECPKCNEVCHVATKICEACGHIFDTEKEEKKNTLLYNDDILANKRPPTWMNVERWLVIDHMSRSSGNMTKKITYYSTNPLDPIINEYFAINHDGYAGQIARKNFEEAIEKGMPLTISYRKEGIYFKIIDKIYKSKVIQPMNMSELRESLKALTPSNN